MARLEVLSERMLVPPPPPLQLFGAGQPDSLERTGLRERSAHV